MIHGYSLGVELRIVLFKLGKERDGFFFETLTRPDPHLLEVALIAKVLRDSDGEVKVKHAMPPITRNKDGFTWVLHTLDDSWESIRAIGALLSL